MNIRRPETPEVLERRKKIRNRWVTGIILFLLIASTAGFAFMSADGNNNNGGNGNVDVTGKYKYNFGNNPLYFSNDLKDIKNISIDINFTLNDYYNQKVYVSNGNYVATNELAVLQPYTEKIQFACYGNCTEDLPEKTCADKMIVVRNSAFERVSQEGNCTFVDGGLRAMDAFLYKIFGFY